MANRYAEIAFTPAVKAAQAAQGSREQMALVEQAQAGAGLLGPDEAALISTRDSFYMATVNETGWPYMQHKGGPPGFLKVLDERRIGFADFRGNRQYVSLGNLGFDPRVCLFLIDYPSRIRLKLLGRARLTTDPAELEALQVPGYRAIVERGWIIEIEGLDWNCSQHITRRFSAHDAMQVIGPLQARVAELEAELARLTA
jgi:predicted pyridoxine 5'-phosphate oxidase superfamily flavin-nucleotide-binding protein